MSEVTVPVLEPLVNVEYGKNLETRRWFILISFCLFSATNTMVSVAYSPILDAASEYYRVDVQDILQFINCFMYLYIGLSFLGAWIASRWFAPTLLIAMALNTLGPWLRYLAGTSYEFALFGQYIASLASCLGIFLPVLISDRWFAAHERTWAVTISSLMTMLGSGIGFLFSAILIERGYGEVHDLTLYHAIICTVPLITGIFSIKERPKIPPSYSAMVKLNDHNGFWKEIVCCLKNVKFVIVAACYGNVFGQSTVLSSIIVLFIPTATLIEQGTIGLTLILAGVFGGFAASTYLSYTKTEKYDPIIKFFMIISLIGLVCLALFIKKGIGVVYVLMAVLGFGLIGFQPCSAQTVVEMTFPIQETISVNFMIVLAQAFGVLGNFLATASFVGDKGLWVIVGLASPCILYVVFFHKTENKRQEAEQKHKTIDVNDVSSLVSAEGGK